MRKYGGKRGKRILLFAVLACAFGLLTLSHGGGEKENVRGDDAGFSVLPAAESGEREEMRTERDERDEPRSETASEEKTDAEKLAYIRKNAFLYPEALVELAEKNREAINFVYDYLANKDKKETAELTDSELCGKLPHFLQWDERWGYERYAGGLLACTGCGPTCLSMAAVYLTGNADYTPSYIAEFAEREGYSVEGQGSAWTLMSEGCESFGIKAKELSLDEGRIRRALERGEPVVCVLGPGDFTENGHFIVLTGFTEGGFTVHDPNSIENSQKTWPYEKLKNQIKNIWSFHL